MDKHSIIKMSAKIPEEDENNEIYFKASSSPTEIPRKSEKQTR